MSNIRVSEHTYKSIKELSKDTDLSMANVVQIAVAKLQDDELVSQLKRMVNNEQNETN